MTDKKLRLLVAGSREYKDRERIKAVLLEFKSEMPIVMHGACYKGADKIANDEAMRLGYKVQSFPADWDRFGKAAGPLRNDQMLKLKPDLVIAFGDGVGTRGVVRGAERRHIPVRREP